MTQQPDTGLIARIIDDIATHAQFDPYADQIPDNLDAAYDIQDQVVAMLQARGVRARPCGYKLAVNSKPLMARFNIDEPAAGRMFSDQKWASGAHLSSGNYRSLLIEPEIMAVMAADMPARTGGHDRQSAQAAVGRFHAAIELVDSRDASIAQSRLASIIAQNVTTEGLVFGGPGIAPQDLDVDNLPVALSMDGTIIGETTGTAPQHPLDAISWLANHLLSRDSMLKAGDVVICGTHMPPPPLGDAGHVLVDMGPLGRVEFTIS